jgi:putative restriction endonuclease
LPLTHDKETVDLAKGVFTSKPGSGYDDVIEDYYHFPATYLRAVEQMVGDQIVYRQPRRGGGDMTYFGIAEVAGVRPDSKRSDHFYADLRNYIDFDSPVPFNEGGRFFESSLQKPDGSVNKGAFGRSVRILPDEEFEAIKAAGFAGLFIEEVAQSTDAQGFSETSQAPFEIARPRVSFTRAFRDRAFTVGVQRAYDKRCAVTGLRLINGGGRAEVQAAHIQPVSANGPDSVRNGIALSGTVHWLFDRGLITFEDDYALRMVESAIPDAVRAVFHASGHLIAPPQPSQRPNPHFLRFHRENIFKG